MQGVRSLGAAALLGVACVGSIGACGGSGDNQTVARPTHARPTRVLVPHGAEVEKLTFFAGGMATEVETADANKVENGAAFPLVAYRQFCDLRREEVGLAEPRLRIVATRDGASTRLAIGDANFNRAGIYVQPQGDRCLYLVTASSVRTMAALAGETAAAPFTPTATPQPTATDEAADERPAIHPWVAQVKRHGAGENTGPGLEQGG